AGPEGEPRHERDVPGANDHGRDVRQRFVAIGAARDHRHLMPSLDEVSRSLDAIRHTQRTLNDGVGAEPDDPHGASFAGAASSSAGAEAATTIAQYAAATPGSVQAAL